MTVPDAYWATDAPTLLKDLDSTPTGLTGAQAATTLAGVGANSLGTSKQTSTARLLARQFLSPIIIILYPTGNSCTPRRSAGS